MESLVQLHGRCRPRQEGYAFMNTHRFLPIVLTLMLFAPAALAADFGVRAGRYDESDSEFVGAELVIGIGMIHVNPNVEYVLDDDVTAGSANVDVIFQFAPVSPVNPYVGAGAGLLYADSDLGGSRTDLVGNLIGGIEFDLALVAPYVQVKYFRTLENDDAGGSRDDLAFAIGLRF